MTDARKQRTDENRLLRVVNRICYFQPAQRPALHQLANNLFQTVGQPSAAAINQWPAEPAARCQKSEDSKQKMDGVR